MPVERQREYETIYIVRPDVAEEDLATIRERVETVIDSEGGHTLRFDDWGPRRLAYIIRDNSEGRKFERGHYQYYRYLVPPGTVTELERNLKLLDNVLKFLTVKIDDNLIPEERLARTPDEEEVSEFTFEGLDDDE
jgi:small subunit ribosomal protein S6